MGLNPDTMLKPRKDHVSASPRDSRRGRRKGPHEAIGVFERKRRIIVIGVEIGPLPDKAVSRYDLLRLYRRRVRRVEEISQQEFLSISRERPMNVVLNPSCSIEFS